MTIADFFTFLKVVSFLLNYSQNYLNLIAKFALLNKAMKSVELFLFLSALT